jgi:hypothetical protein
MKIRWEIMGKFNGRNLYSGSISVLNFPNITQEDDGMQVAGMRWNGKMWELQFSALLGHCVACVACGDPACQSSLMAEYRNDLMEMAEGVIKRWLAMRGKPYPYSAAAQKLLQDLKDTGILSAEFKDRLITLFNKAMGDAYDHGKATAELNAEQGS